MAIEQYGRITEENMYSQRIHMNDDAELYNSANDVTRRDAIQLLEEYSSKLKFKVRNPRVIDVGSADGSVTKILSKYLPEKYKILVGSDINKKSIEFANKTYGDNRLKFIPLNIEGNLPDNLRDAFDNFFSFYTFQWVRNQEKAFTNIYNMLSKNGECFVMFLGYSHIYSLFYALSKSPKWRSLLKDFDTFASPFWNYRDPEKELNKILKSIGFNEIEVKCKQMVYDYKSLDAIKALVTAINPFVIPEDIWPEFLDDFVKVTQDMKLIDEQTGAVKINYNLLVVHCFK
ncbi:hypothetical protein O3G_MSEX000009 [Manduca sexta]|nr:hypothetical protein O3G_MSEX000009 [Manduca sexta]